VFDDDETVGSLAGLVARKIGAHFSSAAQVATGGAASLAAALRHAARLLANGEAVHVIVGGVDTYVLDDEFVRLETAGRLRTEGTAQGLTPGEGAAFALLSAHPPPNGERSTAIFGVGDAAESQSALSQYQSQGRAMLTALRAALTEGGAQESSLGWVISNANGERYGALESLVTRARFYRTRREIMPTTYPAMSVGETGSASGTLALLVATHAFVRGYAPSRLAMIELSSEGPGRAACLVAAVGGGVSDSE
jgi:3-oxoacyl-(acyl-carrier-protein) synthase